MSAADITRIEILEGTSAQPMARMTTNAAANIVQADITSIERKTFDLDGTTPDTPVDTSAIVVANSVFDTLQTDARWTEDATGYNFRDTVAATVLADGGRRYKVEYYFTMATGGPVAKFFEITTKNARSN